MKVQGFILIDVNGVALNNAGSVPQAGMDNKTVTKKIVKNGQTYVYVSGQAWRYWWRDAIVRNSNWKISPVTKVKGKSQVFTDADPIEYDDDDIFGYMRATKGNRKGKKEEGGTEENGKESNLTVTRVSPLKNSVIISVTGTRVSTHFSSASRQNDVPVPYGKEEYSAIMKGMFSLDMSQVGVFSSYNRAGYKNLSEEVRKRALKISEIEKLKDPIARKKDGEGEELFRLPKGTRERRIKDTIKALKFLNGGAMQTCNLDDVTPKFIILASFKNGNHPFSHVATPDPINGDHALLNIEGIKEVLKDYRHEFVGTIYIGRRRGFFDEYSNELNDLEKLYGYDLTEQNGEKIWKELPQVEKGRVYPQVKCMTINEAIDAYCEQLADQVE